MPEDGWYASAGDKDLEIQEADGEERRRWKVERRAESAAILKCFSGMKWCTIINIVDFMEEQEDGEEERTKLKNSWLVQEATHSY